jgi:hypothetical protein
VAEQPVDENSAHAIGVLAGEPERFASVLILSASRSVAGREASGSSRDEPQVVVTRHAVRIEAVRYLRFEARHDQTVETNRDRPAGGGVVGGLPAVWRQATLRK